jgi:DNA-binding response OmpR family regulator
VEHGEGGAVDEGRATGPHLAPASEAAQPKPLRGKRLLIIEDEPLVAREMAAGLAAAGAAIVGPAGNAAAALQLIAGEPVDAALLDANLGGEQVDSIAAALTRREVPFAFVSGYGRESLPPSFATAELMTKPFDPSRLLAVAARLVERPAGAVRAAAEVA